MTHTHHNAHTDLYATNAIKWNKWNMWRFSPLIRTYITENGAPYHLSATRFDISALIQQRFALNGVAVMGRTNP